MLTILIAFDGSETCQAAVLRAARLFPGASGQVVTVWHDAPHDATALAEADAREQAAAGAVLAQMSGFAVADGYIETVETDVADALLGAAAELSADAIVAGAGPVATALQQRGSLPVVVCPTPGPDGSAPTNVTAS